MKNNRTINLVSVGKLIREIRKQRGHTLEEAAHLADISPQHLSLLERGKKRGSIFAYIGIATALNITLDDLFYVNVTACRVSSSFAQDDLFADCSDYEKAVLCEMILALKEVLKRLRK